MHDKVISILNIFIALTLLQVLASWAAILNNNVEEQNQEYVDWLKWKSKYSMKFDNFEQEVEASRRWSKNYRLVNWHNSRPDVTFSMELNKFAAEDKSLKKSGLSKFDYGQEKNQIENGKVPPPPPPAEYDWRKRGVISSVKDQGMSGSDEAFAVTEDLESFHAIKTGHLVNLSVYETSDCCLPSPLLRRGVYECIHSHGGLCAASDYPKPSSDHRCQNNSCVSVTNEARRTRLIPSGDEQAMILAVLQTPLVVFIDAGETSFEMYSAGIYSDPNCSPQKLDHGLQLVGYGFENGTNFWILKNSWGADWGENGYIRIERGVNMCGVASLALYPSE